MIQALDINNAQNTFTARKEFSRILSAAVISTQFRKKLLSDPLGAISNGYSGETFDLKKEEKSRLSSIRAASLAEFAAQLA